jgi:RND family efflux transporter MFP subunit
MEEKQKQTQKEGGRMQKVIFIFILLIVLLALIFAARYFDLFARVGEAIKRTEENGSDQQQKEELVKKVETQRVSLGGQTANAIETVGKVAPASRIEVVARASGNISGLQVNEGDRVESGQVMGRINSDSLQIELDNMRARYQNSGQSLEAVKRTTAQTIKEAETRVSQASQGEDSARIGLETARERVDSAQTDYENAKKLQKENINNARDRAITSYGGYVNFIKKALDSVNYIINAEDGPQLQGLDTGVLSAKSSATLREAKGLYLDISREYKEVKASNPTRVSIKRDIKRINDLLSLTSRLADKTVEVLDNTVVSGYFTQDLLYAQKEKYTSLKSNAVEVLSGAESTLDELEVLELSQKRESDSLQSAIRSAKQQVESAKAQLHSARISKESAQEALASAKRQREQQVLSALAAVDDAQGQLRAVENRIQDLEIKAFATGSVIARNVDEGQEVSPGQVLYEIANVDNVKIIAHISPFDVFDIKVGQEAMINNKYQGVISSIVPSADPQTGKVKLEIMPSDDIKALIPQTSVDVSIPTRKEAEETSFFVPLKAVIVEQEGSFVFIVKDQEDGRGVAQKVMVETGEVQGTSIEVNKGLNNRDLVIVEGAKLVKDGEEVTL